MTNINQIKQNPFPSANDLIIVGIGDTCYKMRIGTFVVDLVEASDTEVGTSTFLTNSEIGSGNTDKFIDPPVAMEAIRTQLGDVSKLWEVLSQLPATYNIRIGNKIVSNTTILDFVRTNASLLSVPGGVAGNVIEVNSAGYMVWANATNILASPTLLWEDNTTTFTNQQKVYYDTGINYKINQLLMIFRYNSYTLPSYTRDEYRVSTSVFHPNMIKNLKTVDPSNLPVNSGYFAVLERIGQQSINSETGFGGAGGDRDLIGYNTDDNIVLSRGEIINNYTINTWPRNGGDYSTVYYTIYRV